MTWDTFLTLRGTKGIYLDHVGTLSRVLENKKLSCTLNPGQAFLFACFANFRKFWFE